MTLHIQDFCEDKARQGDGMFAIACAIFQLAEAQKSCAVQLKYLGNGDASTPFGAMEAFGMHLGEKLDALTTAIGERTAL